MEKLYCSIPYFYVEDLAPQVCPTDRCTMNGCVVNIPLLRKSLLGSCGGSGPLLFAQLGTFTAPVLNLWVANPKVGPWHLPGLGVVKPALPELQPWSQVQARKSANQGCDRTKPGSDTDVWRVSSSVSRLSFRLPLHQELSRILKIRQEK